MKELIHIKGIAFIFIKIDENRFRINIMLLNDVLQFS